jgi:ABC-type branched-subunit amino acid transport system permease subunit
VREDPLAASLMTIPVNRVKLMAFSFGAMVAALAGTVFAAQQVSVFPTNFDTPFLILIYAALILGGAGSITGAIVGALVVEITLDGFLRSTSEAGYIFYGLILLTLIVKLRPWRRLGAVLSAVVAFGFAVHAIVQAISASAVAGGPQSTGFIHDVLANWVIVPATNQAGVVPPGFGNVGFVVLIVLLIAMVRMRRALWRTILMVPTVYLAACVWESRLITEPSITRLILLGAILIVVMNARPQGLLGTRRIEVL